MKVRMLQDLFIDESKIFSSGEEYDVIGETDDNLFINVYNNEIVLDKNEVDDMFIIIDNFEYPGIIN